MLSKRRIFYVEITFICIIAISFFFLSSWNLKKPGVQYDEVYSATPANEFIDGKPISNARHLHIKGKEFPFMATKYRGALMSYLLAAAFSIFGVNVCSFRITAIIIGTVGVVLTYFFTKKMFGQKAAIISIVLLTVAPSHILYVRHDFGAVAIMLACKMGSLLLFYKWWNTGKMLHLSVGFLLMALGLWNKIDFIWFTAALPLSVSFFYYKELKSRIGIKEALCGIFFISFFIVGLLFYFKTNLFSRPSSTYTGLLDHQTSILNFIISQLKHKYGIFRGMLTEGGMPALILRASPRGLMGMKGTFSYYLFLISSASYLFTLYISFKNHSFNKKHLFIPLMCLLIFLQIVITPQATGGHHTMMLYPFIHIFFGTTLACLFDYFRNKTHIILKTACPAFIVALIVFVALSNLVVLKGFYKELEKSGGRGSWSDAINDLAEYIEKQGDVTVVCMDWGFRHNLLFLSGGKIKTLEPFWRHVSGQNRHVKEVSPEGGYLYLFHSTRYTKYKMPIEAFNETISKSGFRSVIQQKFYQRDGEHIYSLYKVLWPLDYFVLDDNTIRFYDELQSKHLVKGWYSTERWGTWSKGEESLILINFRRPRDYRMLIKAGGLSVPGKQQSVRIYLDDNLLGEHTFTHPLRNFKVFEMKIPSAYIKEGNQRIRFVYNFTGSPAEYGESHDVRQLAMAVSSVEFKEVLTHHEMFGKKIARTLEPSLRRQFLKATFGYKNYINFCENGFQKQIGKGWDDFSGNKENGCKLMGKESVVYLKRNTQCKFLEIEGCIKQEYSKGQILKMRVFLNGIKAMETLIDKPGTFAYKATIPSDLRYARYIKAEIILEKHPMPIDSVRNDAVEIKIAINRIALTKKS